MADRKDLPTRNGPATHISPHARLQPVGPAAVTWTRGFWAEKIALCKDITIPSIRRALHNPDNAASLSNLYAAAGLKEGPHQGLPASDGDCFKWMEAVAHAYSLSHDQELDQLLDEMIAVIARAQAADGYLSTKIQLMGLPRWTDVTQEEPYNLGHLITAACVHHRVTGRDNFLQIARQAADCLYRVFSVRPPELCHFGFTPSHMMAMVDIYRATGDRRYLDLADIFVSSRGCAPRSAESLAQRPGPQGTDEMQDRVPLRQETEAVGHAVAATFLYCGAADLYAETGEQSLWQALERIWNDVVSRKMYITGGVGSQHKSWSRRGDRTDEAFGLNYQLPNATAYNETCANIGNAMWNWRMLGISGEAKYADVLEQVVYNAVLSGISVDGEHFFYTNPLRWYGAAHEPLSHDEFARWQTYSCYCCPPNLARTLAGLHNWLYSLSPEGVWVHLYGGSRLETTLASGATLALTQETAYPWDGTVTITIEKAPVEPLAVMLRIPAWAERATVAVNRQPVGVRPGTYATLLRRWSAGDVIELAMPMPVRLVQAHPKVEEARGQVAIGRGPVVYCLEELDLPAGVALADVRIARRAHLRPRHDPALLGGVTVLEGKAQYVPSDDWQGRLYRTLPDRVPLPVPIRLIPYYAWNNRGVTPMSVWLPLG